LVKKPDGSPLEYVTVSVYPQGQTKCVGKEQTDRSGSAKFDLTPGTYTVVCTYKGVKLNQDIFLQGCISVMIGFIFD